MGGIVFVIIINEFFSHSFNKAISDFNIYFFV